VDDLFALMDPLDRQTYWETRATSMTTAKKIWRRKLSPRCAPALGQRKTNADAKAAMNTGLNVNSGRKVRGDNKCPDESATESGKALNTRIPRPAPGYLILALAFLATAVTSRAFFSVTRV